MTDFFNQEGDPPRKDTGKITTIEFQFQRCSQSFCREHGHEYLETLYWSGFALMERDRTVLIQVLIESGFGEMRMAAHIAFWELAVEFLVDFQTSDMFAEAEGVYGFACSESGKRLAYSQTRGSDPEALPITDYLALMSGSRYHPLAVEFRDFEDMKSPRAKRQRTDEVGSTSGEDDIFGGRLSWQESADEQSRTDPGR